MTTLDALEDQKNWEMRWVREGVARYRATSADQSLSDTGHGQWVVNKLVLPVSENIALAQDLATTAMANPTKGQPSPIPLLMSLLSPEVLAYITVKTILDAWAAAGTHADVAGVAERIGSAARLELEFQLWRADSKRRAQENKRDRKEDDTLPEVPDLAKIILTKSKDISPKAFARWKRKIAEIERIEWPKVWKVTLGAALIDIAVKHGGGWFETMIVYQGGRGKRRVGLTEDGRGLLATVKEDIECRTPVLMPMICPPLDWVREPPSPSPSSDTTN